MKDPMDGHKCIMIAKAHNCGEGREFWIGELLEPIEGYPETHCIHIKTPAKEVVFGVNSGDAVILAIAGQIIHMDVYGKPINRRYIDLTENIYRDTAMVELGVKEPNTSQNYHSRLGRKQD